MYAALLRHKVRIFNTKQFCLLQCVAVICVAVCCPVLHSYVLQCVALLQRKSWLFIPCIPPTSYATQSEASTPSSFATCSVLQLYVLQRVAVICVVVCYSRMFCTVNRGAVSPPAHIYKFVDIFHVIYTSVTHMWYVTIHVTYTSSWNNYSLYDTPSHRGMWRLNVFMYLCIHLCMHARTYIHEYVYT